MRRNSEKGFSLIELSIVLIIIGLLIAGITGGASLVKSATVRAVISEANSYNSAVNAYYAQFSNLPGDDSNGATRGDATAVSGNGNGRIEYQTAAGSNIFEGLSMWGHLVAADIVEGSFTYTTGGITVGEHIPTSKLSAAGWYGDFRGDMNMIVLGRPVALTTADETSVTSSNVISAENAKSIDTKMDDGVSDQGKVRGYTSTTVSPLQNDAMDYATTNQSTPTGHIGFALAL